MKVDQTQRIRVDVLVGIGGNIRSCFVAPGTAVGMVLRDLVSNLDELLAQGFALSRSYSGDASPSEVSMYELIEQDVVLLLMHPIIGRRELGKDELAEALNSILAELSDIRTRFAPPLRQLRTDLNHIHNNLEAHRPHREDPIGFLEFWGRFVVHLWRNVRRYFWLPFLANGAMALALAAGFLWFEKGRNQGIETLMDALYAVAMFMVTVGYRADMLSVGGRLIGVMASLLGLMLFGTLVSLTFYSLQD